jgi:hypothetical protein
MVPEVGAFNANHVNLIDYFINSHLCTRGYTNKIQRNFRGDVALWWAAMRSNLQPT